MIEYFIIYKFHAHLYHVNHWSLQSLRKEVHCIENERLALPRMQGTMLWSCPCYGTRIESHQKESEIHVPTGTLRSQESIEIVGYVHIL